MKRFVNCPLLFDKYYTRDSEIDNVHHDFIEIFIKNDLNNEYQTFGELYNTINEAQIKTVDL